MTGYGILTKPRFPTGKIPLYWAFAGPPQEGGGSGHDRTKVWAFWIRQDGSLRLSRLDNNPYPHLSAAPSYTADVDGKSFEWVSAEFDQNDRRVLAWQIGGEITLSYIQTGVPETERRVRWAGLEPMLFWDGTLLQGGELTDLICFYLTPDRRGVRYRLQRDLYAVEYPYLTLPEPMGFARWKVVGLELCLTLVNAAGTVFETRTDPYPLYLADYSGSTARMSGGAYSEAIVVRDPYAEAGRQAGRLGGGSFRLSGQEFDAVREAAYQVNRLGGGSFRLSGQEFDAVREAAYQPARFSGGLFALRYVSSGDEGDERAALRPRFGSGSYVERAVARDGINEAASQGYRFRSGSYRNVNLPSDPLGEASFQATPRLGSGAFTQRVYSPLSPEDSALLSARLRSGGYRQQNQLGDTVTDLGTVVARLRSGNYLQLVQQPYGADADAGRIWARLASGSLIESNRIQRFTEAAQQAARLRGGSLNMVTLIAVDPLAEGSLQVARLSGGAYALAATRYPLYDLHRLFDAGDGPEAEPLEFLYTHLGGY